MATDDPRDPRNERRSINKSLDKLSSGFDAFLTDQRALRGEQQATMREIASALTMVAKVVQDSQQVAGGSAGLPLASGAPGAEAYVRAMGNSRPGLATNNTQEKAAQRSLFDYDLNPSKNLGAQTRTGLRANIFNNVSARAAGVADEYNDMQNWTELSDGHRFKMEEGYSMDALGRVRNAQGRFIPADQYAGAISQQASQGDQNSLARKMAMMNTASRVAGQWNAGQPVGRALMSAAPAGLLKAAGIAGAVAYGTDKVIDTIQDQAAQNRGFQSVYGGDLGDQWDDRAAQWMNRNINGRFSLLGGGNYDALFKGGMGMGLRGDDRSQYISTGADIMGKTGASSEFTNSIMQKTIESGLALDGLADSIKNVSDAAKDAGINANRAREIFQKNYEAGATVMFDTPGARQFAEYQTLGQINQGRQFQGVSNAGAFNNMNMVGLYASNSGMSMTDYLSAAAVDPGFAIAGAEGSNKEVIRTAFPNIDADVAEFMADIKKRTGEDYTPRIHQGELGRFLLDVKDYLPMTATQVLQQLKYEGITNENSLGFMGNLFTNQSPGTVALGAQAETKANFTSRPFEAGESRSTGAGLQVGLKDAAFGIPGSMDNGSRSDMQRSYYSMIAGKTGSDQDPLTSADLIGKERRPILEQLIQSESLRPGKTKVSVVTKDGRKVISLEEALRDFPDQLESGMAIIEEGAEEAVLGKSTTEMLGVPQEISSKIKTDSQNKSIDYGDDYDKYIEDKEKDDDKKGDVVQFTLTDDARALLKMVGTSPYYSPNPAEWDGNNPVPGGN